MQRATSSSNQLSRAISPLKGTCIGGPDHTQTWSAPERVSLSCFQFHESNQFSLCLTIADNRSWRSEFDEDLRLTNRVHSGPSTACGPCSWLSMQLTTSCGLIAADLD